jgi:hypothetical protein
VLVHIGVDRHQSRVGRRQMPNRPPADPSRLQNMEVVVSLVLSVVAILISAASVWYVRASAKANHTDRTPRLSAEYLPVRTDHPHEAIRIINGGPVDLIEVSIAVASDANPITSGLAGAKVLEHRGPWAIGDGDSFAMNRVSQHGGSVTLRCVCVAAGGETWTVFVSCEVPSSYSFTGSEASKYTS